MYVHVLYKICYIELFSIILFECILSNSSLNLFLHYLLCIAGPKVFHIKVPYCNTLSVLPDYTNSTIVSNSLLHFISKRSLKYSLCNVFTKVFNIKVPYSNTLPYIQTYIYYITYVCMYNLCRALLQYSIELYFAPFFI